MKIQGIIKVVLVVVLFTHCMCLKKAQKGYTMPQKQMQCQVPPQSQCPAYPHCIFYQVTEQLQDYGCTKCKVGYEEVEDVNGAGYCVKNTSILGCTWASLVGTKHVCYECLPFWLLSEDQSTCSPPSSVTIHITGCLNYSVVNGEQVCNECFPEFTLSENQKSCHLGCPINNCRTCEEYGGKVYCFACKNNYIGVYNTSNELYTECLSCSQLISKLD